MKASELTEIGQTGVQVTRLGLGGTALSGSVNGSVNAVPTSREEALALINSCLDAEVRYFDTAPMYGLGESEHRYGSALNKVPRSSFTISTKVGRLLVPGDPSGWQFDFSKVGVNKSLKSSLERLGLDFIDILYIHDPDGDVMFRTDHREYFDEAISEALPALQELKKAGKVRAIGVGMNQWEMELRFAREGQFDCFLLAGRYTLLDQSALGEFLPFCYEHNISVVAGGPFNSGVLAQESGQAATFNYAEAPEHITARVERLREVCTQFSVPLKAAALQFILAHPAIASVIPGARSVEEMKENVAMVEHSIPSEFWSKLKADDLLPAEAPTPS